MAVKRILSLLLVCALLVGICGCAPMEEAIDSELGTKIDAEQIQTESDIHLRDKDLLYTQYDNTEIVTMYLTVSSGNAGEGTNHTWEEVNTYSAYDYDCFGREHHADCHPVRCFGYRLQRGCCAIEAF